MKEGGKRSETSEGQLQHDFPVLYQGVFQHARALSLSLSVGVYMSLDEACLPHKANTEDKNNDADASIRCTYSSLSLQTPFHNQCDAVLDRLCLWCILERLLHLQRLKGGTPHTHNKT